MSAIYPAIFTGIRQTMFIAGAHEGVGQEGSWCDCGVAALTAPVQQRAPQSHVNLAGNWTSDRPKKARRAPQQRV